ncbi:hypothetical protein Verru16b_02587 [Lacunisphaera limnophila]|uniref:Methyltransferase FkbM domain-containing protein n=1 Tax=Lacunisphaera limnophila TaxID=1838286 RepID=A0A1D8AXA0_9BACT|nr:FkbM family methyltransferase [Lacunisphaera limnophila]AOS45506.1 hypothetical protein Verru16b_02587 [Lacunisphaera limnophila]
MTHAVAALTFRQKVKTLPVLGGALEGLWRGLTGRTSLEFELRRSRKLPPDATIVKIGSNDGFQDDPTAALLISRPLMRCVFVEPVPHLLDGARRCWGNSPRFTYLAAAVNDGSPATFYYVDPAAKSLFPDLTVEPDLLGSLDRNHILKHPDCARLEPYIRALPLRGLTLEGVFAQGGVSHLDVLHIDAEGWDWKILRQLDLSIRQPTFIIMEYIHLDPTEQREARARFDDTYEWRVRGTDWVWEKIA